MPRKSLVCCLGALALGLCAAAASGATAPKVTKADFAAIFQRDPISAITLSPDGRHLAYVAQEKAVNSLIIVDVDHPLVRTSIRIGTNRFLGWTSSETLVYAPPGEIRAINADGKKDRKLVDLNDIPFYDIDTSLPEYHTSKPYPRVPEVVEMVPTMPDTIMISVFCNLPPLSGAGGTQVTMSATDYYLLNVRTGDRQHLDHWDYKGRALADQNGALRMYATDSVDGQFLAAQTFKIFAADRMWHNFDQTTGKEAGLVFKSDPSDFFAQRSFPLGFGPDPNLLYFASNVDRDTYGIFSFDLAAQKRAPFSLVDTNYDLASPDDVLTDKFLSIERSSGKIAGIRRTGHPPEWEVPELASVQQQLNADFPGRSIQLVDWSDDHERVLFLASSRSDPGRYFVHTADSDHSVEFLRRAGNLNLAKVGTAAPIDFVSPEGVHLTGTLTQPRNPVINPPPLVVYCRDFPSEPPADGFSPDAQALAAIGFVVLEVNHRGMLGFGQRHLNAVKDGLDIIPLADIRAAIAWTEQQQKIDQNRIAIVGEGLGGFLATRALELFPDDFRCAICINAPVSPVDWVYGSAGSGASHNEAGERQKAFLHQISNLSRYSATSGAAAITKPVLIMQESGGPLASDAQGLALRSAIRAGKGDVELESLNHGFSARDPNARATAYVQIADFMRSSLYDYNVKIGPVRTVK